MLNPPTLLPPPQIVPVARPVSVPVPTPLAPSMPHAPSPTVVNIAMPQHLMRRPVSSVPTLPTPSPVPVPVPVVPGRAPPPLVPDHFHSQTSRLTSPIAQPIPLPVPTPASTTSSAAQLTRPASVPASSLSTTSNSSLPLPSLPVPPTPTHSAPSAAQLVTAQQAVPLTPILTNAPLQHVVGPTPAPPHPAGYTPRQQPFIPSLPPPTPPTPASVPPVAAPSGLTVTIVTPHSSTSAPPVPLPVPTPCSTASQSLSVPFLTVPPPLSAAAPVLHAPLTASGGTENTTIPAVPSSTAAEKPRPPAIEDLPRPCFVSWVYPTLEALPELTTTRIGFLGPLGAPRVLRHPQLSEAGMDGHVFQTVPQPVGPAYIVFGGARYESLLLAVPKPPFRAPDPSVGRADARREEVRRVRHLTDQLDVARDYLHLYSSGAGGRADGGASATRMGSSSGSNGVQLDLSDIVVKKNIWNAAYGGTPTELNAMIEAGPSKEMVDSVGYVVHSRRQWGLKKNKEVYELGLGQKGTPLQFAAISGKIDNVLLLLASGARDMQRPFLKDLLPTESYREINAIFKPRTAVKKKRLKGTSALDPAALSGGVVNPSASLSSKPITLYAFEMEEPR